MIIQYFDRNNKMIHIGSKCKYEPDGVGRMAYPEGLEGTISYEEDLSYFNSTHIDKEGNPQPIKWQLGHRFVKSLEVIPK